MEWLYLALTLLAAVLAVVTSALQLYREYRESNRKEKEDKDLLRQSLDKPVGSSEVETHTNATYETPRE